MTPGVWPPLSGTYERSGRLMWQACCLGHEPVESLHPIDREYLLVTLLDAGWGIPQIAGLTRQSWYTTSRILRRVAVDRRLAAEAAWLEGLAA